MSARARAVVGSLFLLTAGCVGDNPIDVDGRVGVFGLLGGLAVGEALTLEGAQAERIALPGNAEGANYVIVPFLGSDADADVTIGIQGATLLDAVGPPAARVSAHGTRLLGRPSFSAEAATARFHERLRRSEIQQLEPRLRSMDRRLAGVASRTASEPPAAAPGADPAAAPAAVPARVPVVGELLSLTTINDASADICAAPLERGGRVVAVSNTAVVVSDTLSPAELAPSEFAAIAAEFDQLVYPVGVETFGAPTDLDANGRIIVFFSPVVNDREAAGFFFAGDLFPRSECAASNEAEIVYILSPDPFGETALQVSIDAVSFLATDFLAHELQHLINATRRIYVNDAEQLESVWMNEGLSHVAEELMFYELTSFGPGENLALEQLQSESEVANRFLVGNFLFYASYMEDPTAATLTGDDNNATRGAAWAFLRYAADQEGRPDTEFFHDLVNSTTNGFANLNQVLETGDALDMMQAWTASVFSDDFIDGLPDFLTQPSWNFRSALPTLMDDGAFPLDLDVLQANGGRTEIQMNGGGSAFFRISVGSARTGDVQIDVAGATADALRVTVIRSH